MAVWKQNRSINVSLTKSYVQAETPCRKWECRHSKDLETGAVVTALQWSNMGNT